MPAKPINKEADIGPEIDHVTELMGSVLEDTGVPRNIRNAIGEARNKIAKGADRAMGVVEAIYALDDISNDINMPAHTRTEIWEIISCLEAIKEKIK